MDFNNLKKMEKAMAIKITNAGKSCMAAWKRLPVFCRFGESKLFPFIFIFFLLSLIPMVPILLYPESAIAKERLKWMVCSRFSIKLGAWDKMNESDGEIVQFFVNKSCRRTYWAGKEVNHKYGRSFEANRTIKDNMVSEVVFPGDFIDKTTGSRGATDCLYGEICDYTWRIVVGGNVIDSGKIKPKCHYDK